MAVIFTTPSYGRLACLIGLTGLLGACHHPQDPQPPTPTALLTGPKWQLQASTIVAPDQPLVDLYILTNSFTKDDFERFELPNVFVTDEGPTKYSANTPQTQQGTWTLSTDNTQLTITYMGRTKTYAVQELNATSLRLQLTQLQSNGVSSQLTNTFSPIP